MLDQFVVANKCVEVGELRRQCDGRFLDTRGAGPEVSQGPILESGGATTGWNDRTAGTAGTGPLCRARGTVGEGLCRVYAAARIRDRGNESRWPEDFASVVGSSDTGYVDRLRKRDSAAAGAWTATPAGVRSAQRVRDGAHRSVARGLDRTPIA